MSGGKLPAVPKSRKVELRLLDINGQPMRRVDCELTWGSEFSLSQTTDDGNVTFDVPMSPDEGDLVVKPHADKPLRISLRVFLSRYGDATTGPGLKARLNNLGYLLLDDPPDQALAGKLDDAFNRALARFRRANHFDVNTPSATVTERLTDAHDTATGPLTK